MSKAPDSPLLGADRQDSAAIVKKLESITDPLATILAAGEREIAAGEGHSLESVLKEADALGPCAGSGASTA